MKNFTFILLFCVLCMGALSVNAQIIGPDSISTCSNSTYTYTVTLPGDAFMDDVNASVSVMGGIELVSVDGANNTITITSKQGTTKEDFFQSGVKDVSLFTMKIVTVVVQEGAKTFTNISKWPMIMNGDIELLPLLVLPLAIQSQSPLRR